MAKKKIENKLLIVGMKGASKQQLARVEQLISCCIPNVYRKFLEQHNGGIPNWKNIDYGKNLRKGTRLRAFFSLEGSAQLSLEFVVPEYRDRLPKGCFPIARDEFDNLIVLDAKSRVLLWDHERELGDNRPELIANDFQTFLEMLTPDESGIIRIATITFTDGSSCRQQAESNAFSKTRNAIVPIETLTKGEVIEEFGEIKQVRSIVITAETY